MAGGKVLVGGTAYDITKGKTLVGGTAYDITAGKMLIGGTGYDIKFSTMPTLEELFSSATIVATTGRNSSTAGAAGPLKESSVPSSGTAYLIVMFNGYMSFYKIINRVISQTSVAHNGTYGGNHAAGVYYRTSNTNKGYYFSPYQYESGTGTGTTVFGATLALLTFPYSDTVVDSVLSGATITRIAGHGIDTGGTGYTSSETTTDKTKEVYFACRANTFDVWKPNGNTYTKVTGTSTAAAEVINTTTLRVTAYGCSIIGLSS